MQCIVYGSDYSCIAYIDLIEVTSLLTAFLSVLLVGWCLLQMFLIVLKQLS